MTSNNVTSSFTFSVFQGVQNGKLVPTAIASVLVFGLYLVFGGSRSHGRRVDSEEPPVIPSKITFIGHMVGLLRWQFGYFQMLRYASNLLQFGNALLTVETQLQSPF